MSEIKYDNIRIFKDCNCEEVKAEFNRVFLEGKDIDEQILIDKDLTIALPNIPDKKELIIKDENQFAIAKKVNEILGGRKKTSLYFENYSLWIWLTFAYSKYLFEYSKGQKKILLKSNYWPDDSNDYKTSARHRIRGLCNLYANHGEKADFILNRSLSKRGELVEQLSQNAAFHNPNIFGVFRKLFWNERKKTLKKGHTDKQIGARAVVAEIKKLMFTHACELMTPDEIIQIIHPRFKEKWLGEGDLDD